MSFYCKSDNCTWCGPRNSRKPAVRAHARQDEPTALADAQSTQEAAQPDTKAAPSVEPAPAVPPSAAKEEPVPASPPHGEAASGPDAAAPGASLTAESPTSHPSMPGSAPDPWEPGRP